MTDRKTKGLLVAVVAALFVLSFSSLASAQPFAITGKIVALDSSSRILTLQQNQCGLSGTYYFNWANDATVMKGKQPESFSNLKVGDEATVSYFQKADGNYVADDINIMPAMMHERC